MSGDWTYAHPTRVHFGDQSLGRLPQIVDRFGSGPVVMLTGGHSAAANGQIDAVRDNLPGRTIALFDAVEPEPSHATVESAAGFISDEGAAVVIALGGGSVMDAAKAATCLVGVASDVAPYMDRVQAFEGRSIPLIAMPTTAGTGSEVTPFSVLTNQKTQQKKSLPSPHFYPDDAVVVPAFVTTVPTKVRGDVGIDSLAHAYEALWSVNANPVSDALAYRAITVIASAFVSYYDDPGTPAAADMACGSMMAGLAFSNTMTAGCHALSYPLCDRLHISHGAACAITLEHVADLNKLAARPKFEILAELLGLSSWEEIPLEISRLRKHATTIPSLGDLGVQESDLMAIADGAFQPLLRNNPVEMTQDVIIGVLRRAI